MQQMLQPTNESISKSNTIYIRIQQSSTKIINYMKIYVLGCEFVCDAICISCSL